ncbi:MAG: tRNA dihydrouridine synthase DusB [PVC group bacterium]|nr:tRNA dihydrouridine synthase DusB [PVC group bacterium]
MFKFGNLSLSTPIILAPMAGITSYPVRMLNRRFGCEFAFTEMVDANSLNYTSRKTIEILRTGSEDRPLGIQLLGNDADQLRQNIDILRDWEFDILDLNAACPQRKVTRRDKGACLLKSTRRLNKLLKVVVKHSHVPVTVKIRLGWDDPEQGRDIALCAQDAGVCAVIVHGRTKIQMFTGTVDYASLKKVKDAVNIPVIASGDVFSAQLAKKMFDETGADAVAVARGSLGNPWIFKEIETFLKTGKIPLRPSSDELVQTMKLHFDMFNEFYGEQRSVVNFRSFFIWYTRGAVGVRPLRNRISQVKTKQDMLDLIDEFRNNL